MPSSRQEDASSASMSRSTTSKRGASASKGSTFASPDLDAHWKRVEAWGVEVSDLVETDWMNFFIVRDLDDHEIVFAVTDPEIHGTDPW